jgi:hypothetical protein
MKTIYISGPMSGLPEFNYQAFMAKENELLDQGHKVQNPAHNSSVDGNGDPKTWKGFMIDALHQLELCTHIHFLEGWKDSPGARIEAIAAERMGIKIYK